MNSAHPYLWLMLDYFIKASGPLLVIIAVPAWRKYQKRIRELEETVASCPGCKEKLKTIEQHETRIAVLEALDRDRHVRGG